MVILIKSSAYDAFTYNQNLKLRNVQARNGLILGEGKRVVKDSVEWQAFSYNTIDLQYAETLATALAMFENNAMLIMGFEDTSIENYKTANSIPTHNQPETQDVAETNLAIQTQGTTWMRVEESLNGYADVEEPPFDNFIRKRAIKQKEQESFEWLNSYLSEGFDYAINSKTYNIPVREEDIGRYAQESQLFETNGVPDTAPTHLRAYDYDLNKHVSLGITYGEFKVALNNLAMHFKFVHGQRSANMDAINNLETLQEIENYKFRILGQ